MSFFRNKIVLALIGVTVVVVIMCGIMGGTNGNGAVGNVMGVIFSPAQKAVSFIASSVNRFTVFIWEMHSYKEENDRLVAELNELKKDNKGIDDYKAENERLTELLGLKESMPEYDTEAARIIAYEPNNWYETFVINKGSKDGIAEEAVVMTSSGIVGQVSEAGENWARVSAVINIDNSVGVRVVRTGDIAITEGDVSLAKDGYCKMSFMSQNAAVIVGDLLETSGLGGVYPAGMMVGKVREILMDSSGSMQYAVVEPTVDFDELREVLVIKNVQ